MGLKETIRIIKRSSSTRSGSRIRLEQEVGLKVLEGKAVVRVGSVEVVKLERGGVGEGVGKGWVGSGVGFEGCSGGACDSSAELVLLAAIVEVFEVLVWLVEVGILHWSSNLRLRSIKV